MTRAIKNVSVIVRGVEHSLSTPPYHFLGESGLGAAPQRRFNQSGPNQHGETDLGYRLQARIFGLALGIEAEDYGDLWDKRNNLLKWFAPYNKPILKLVLANDVVRYLDCVWQGDLSMPSSDRIATLQRVGIDLKAPSPLFYDPVARTINFALSGGGGEFTVPTAVPTGIGASTIDQSRTVNYGGTFLEHPVIRIIGPITDVVIQNVSTGEKLDFSGHSIGSGDYYDIDTRFSAKTVMDAAGDSKLHELSDDSNLGTFHLAPDSEKAPGGINTIRVTGSDVSNLTKIIITYYLRYIGI